ncbi:hypothetical protein CLV24_103306 [Pontibacter ummariensis]|uniref:Uncharacterized protein n=1 Tax=Pontibacter ummariensis TaxID=1610492 RepID=A0A239CEK2_9BACT|nr:hypothetical protein [Pontibacter ummariensis]PRY15067.1 hypothetical protein CLV24_103306 [Pontibacter ummariensis]SNS18389.1 hypothetical protein SAMN06296052_1037 [Pontibacter ummariensis]
MSELSNPLFDNEREFLERQKEEYKNALMGDVDQIKAQGQEMGKKAAIAGGVLLAGYLLKCLFSSSDKKKEKKEAKKEKHSKSKHRKASETIPVQAPLVAVTPHLGAQREGSLPTSVRAVYPHPVQTAPPRQEAKKSFFESDVAKALTQQVVALAMVYATKKLEDYLSGVSENDDIAAKPIEVTEIETTEYIIPKEDAV